MSRPYDGRAACNNCGPCDIGCTIGTKSSTDVTYWPKALKVGAVLETHARIREITVGPNSLANGAIYYDANGTVRWQEARVVVMACNGVGTPRLLLNSKSSLYPDGLANRRGKVGRNLMFHPASMVPGIFDEPMDGHHGPIGCSILIHEFYETHLSREFVRGYGFQVVRSSGPVHTALGGIMGHRIPWGADHRRVFRERWARTCTIAVIGENSPEEHNRVTLDSDLVDSDGIPAPRVTYTLSENSQEMMAHGVTRAQEVLGAAGAREILVNPLLEPAGWHLMGTARMGADSNHSVVNDIGRCHDVKNLFIIDSSIFVTGGAVNPTPTIQVLALYLADQVKKNARNMFD